MDTFDHHCPAIGNCVGRGNQRSFAAWLGVLLSAQLLFLHLSCYFCARVARHSWATARLHDEADWSAIAPGLWLVFGLHPGKVLLILLQVSCCLPISSNLHLSCYFSGGVMARLDRPTPSAFVAELVAVQLPQGSGYVWLATQGTGVYMRHAILLQREALPAHLPPAHLLFPQLLLQSGLQQLGCNSWAASASASMTELSGAQIP